MSGKLLEVQKVFILGNPRSGTSLLRIMLNSHPKMTAPPESGFAHWWFKKYENWCLKDSCNPKRINAFIEDLMSSKKIETWNLNAEALAEYILEKQPANYSDLTGLIYLFWANGTRKSPRVIIDKNNYYIKHLQDLLRIWPEAKFIFLIRDGRDVACSYLGLQKVNSSSPYKPVLPSAIKEIALEWSENNQTIFKFLSNQDKSNWFLIKYEDLVSDTQATLEQIARFLNVDFSEEMLRYYLMNDEPALTLDWKKKTLEEPDISNIGKYKTDLSAEDALLFNNLAGRTLSLFGYE